VRRFLVVLIALLAVPLAAAGPSDLLGKPSVIVYPFTATTSTINREATSQLATIIATQMAATGRVTVIPPPPGTERKDYLSVARAQNAEYYIAGFMSPLGDGVSVVEQVVSTTSGIVVSSNSSQLQTYADAAGQGEQLALIVSRHANRALASIGTAPPAASPTAAPTAEAQANLGRLFTHRRKPGASPTPAASAKPLPVATAPAPALVNVTPPPATPAAVAAHQSSIAVLTLAGSANTGLRDAATERIATRAHADRTSTIAAACADHPRLAILSGFLIVKPDAGYGTRANLALFASDCRGKTLWNRSFSSSAGGAKSAQLATQRVVDAAIVAYLSAPNTPRS
jgi:TolB-like protein